MIEQKWFTCDGSGRPSDSLAPGEVRLRPTLDRRAVLAGLALATLGWMTRRTAIAQLAVSGSPTHDRSLVVIFLRGGLDGLNTVTPYREDEYYKARPNLSLRAPGQASDALIDLDGFFGLNPAFTGMDRLYRDGRLAVVHACGSFDRTRSHFQAMHAMERGLPNLSRPETSGWLGRHLNATRPETASPLRAVSFGAALADSMRGATGATAIQSLDEFRLDELKSGGYRTELSKLYAVGDDAMSVAGRETLKVFDLMDRLNPRQYRPASGAEYPDTVLGNSMKQIAFLIKNRIGLEVATVDFGAFDTHVTQGTTTGWLATLLNELGMALSAFSTDLGADLDRTTVIVQTEFGRRIYENGGLGTDHGRASCLFALGGGVRGGKVFGEWPGLSIEQREGPGDLRVTTDYRNVLAEALYARFGNDHAAEVFPGLVPNFSGIFDSR